VEGGIAPILQGQGFVLSRTDRYEWNIGSFVMFLPETKLKLRLLFNGLDS
jgi:hypothetical protein